MAPRADANLLALQGSIKRDPSGYEEDFELQYRHYKACLNLFSLKPSEESQDFADLVTFVAQVTSCYPERTREFAAELSALLERHYAVMNSSLRQTLAKSLILLRNRKQVPAMELLPLFFRLFRCQDKSLRQLLYRHIISDIKAANQKHQDAQLNRAVQNFLYSALEDPHEAAAKKSLAVLIELWRRHVWQDARTVNVIASAALHSSSRLMLASLKFFLGQDELDPDDSEDEADEAKLSQPSKAEVFRATKKGTAASKKKKGAKLKRVMAAVKKQQRRSRQGRENFAAIQLLHDPQKFAEELLKRLQKSAGERFEARLAMMSVISRVIGVHRLLLLNFYPFMQKFVLPHQRDAPALLALLVQAVHEELPPDTLAPILRQLVDQFVHDRARPEVMTLGLKTVRELCERAPLIMTAELLQDLALYKKFREKEVASAARSLITLFREVAPVMLEKRDRGRDADLAAAPTAFGARRVASRIEGAELLQAALADNEAEDSEDALRESLEETNSEGALEEVVSGSEIHQDKSDIEDSPSIITNASDADCESVPSSFSGGSNSDAGTSDSEDEEPASMSDKAGGAAKATEEEEAPAGLDTAKRKRTSGSLSDLKKQLAAAGAAKKAKAEARKSPTSDIPLEYERILTEEDFAQIRELRHQKLVDELMRKHGLKSAAKRERLLAAAQDEAEEALDKLGAQASRAEQRVNPESLTGRHKVRQNKQDRLLSVHEGRQGREFGASAARKNNKAGGKSNKEKLKSKNLPLAARKAVARRRAGKHRRGASKISKSRSKRMG